MKDRYERHEVEVPIRHVLVERDIPIRDVCEELGIHQRCLFNFRWYPLGGVDKHSGRARKVTLSRVAEAVAKLSGRPCRVEELLVQWKPDFGNGEQGQ